MPDGALSDRRVLTVEDEYFIAQELEEALRKAGVTVLGPASSVGAALALLDGGTPPEAAVLDVNLAGEMVYPVADRLIARGIPFLFTTGYDRSSLPTRFARVRRLEKPFEPFEVLRVLRKLFDAAGTGEAEQPGSP
ncbi:MULTISPECIES: response regulator [unclassified Methylobacterium]|jgi:CheY-like chemotaxis protein|uniref:response regulator n=1 Tax=unclassified Methylobacterium TaxID=2615210 RepID=UPI0013530D0C|nr:response regulator [Methylobacterium sp. 2A]MWV23337.1 response regulator [Methylobacterium sp. 2A]